MNFRRKAKPVTGLNVTPLIDVVFILLVFFMLATNFARYRLISIETPQDTKVLETAEGAIVIDVLPDGGTAFDGDKVERAAIGDKVADVVAIDPGRSFLIRPEPGVTLQEAIVVYDAARGAGAVAVSFSPPKEG